MTGTIPPLTLGWRLRMAIEHAGIPAGRLAEELSIDRGTLTRWMHDKYRRPINPLFLRAIAERCGVPYEWLVEGSTSEGGA